MSIRALAVARQPIYDRSFELHGYELLYRRTSSHTAAVVGDQMTAEVVLAATEFALLSEPGTSTYLNVDRGLLLSTTLATTLPPGLTIEVLETVLLDDEVVAACTDLVARGFRLALDDFVWRPGCEAILALASVVKIDVLSMTRIDAEELFTRCRTYGVELLAEKVETEEQLSWAVDLGFDLFQGYWLARPELRQTQRLDSTGSSHLRLATEILSPDFDLQRVEEIVRLDPALSLQLLKFAGAGSAHGTRRQIRTVREALVLCGERRIRGWVSLIVLSRSGLTTPQSLEAGLACARMCELLSLAGDASAAFTAAIVAQFLGLFDAEDAPVQAWLDPGLLATALHHEGAAGRVLAEVQEFQRSPDEMLQHTAMPRDQVLSAAEDATRWSIEVLHSLA